MRLGANHFATLRHAYRQAPYFKDYAAGLKRCSRRAGSGWWTSTSPTWSSCATRSASAPGAAQLAARRRRGREVRADPEPVPRGRRRRASRRLRRLARLPRRRAVRAPRHPHRAPPVRAPRLRAVRAAPFLPGSPRSTSCSTPARKRRAILLERPGTDLTRDEAPRRPVRLEPGGAAGAALGCEPRLHLGLVQVKLVAPPRRHAGPAAAVPLHRPRRPGRPPRGAAAARRAALQRRRGGKHRFALPPRARRRKRDRVHLPAAQRPAEPAAVNKTVLCMLGVLLAGCAANGRSAAAASWSRRATSRTGSSASSRR